jgi:hypothetical protein
MTWGCSCPQCGADDCKNFGSCGGDYQEWDGGGYILNVLALMVSALVMIIIYSALNQ